MFNPKEEALLDNLKFSNQSANLMKEALEHMANKNENLADEL